MNDRDDQSIDHELSGVAMAAAHEHEQTVSSDETEAALTAVRSRIAGGDLGGVPASIDVARERRRRSPLIMLSAVAAVIGMLALGLVTVLGGDRTNDVIIPATVPSTDPGASVPATTDADTAASVPSEPVATEFVEQTISVDAANPPTLIEPTVWRSVPIDASNVESLADVGVADDSVLVKQKGDQSITVLDRVGDGRRDVAIEEDVSSITAGPVGSVYGLGDLVFAPDNPDAPTGFRFVGISLVDGGPADAGQVFAFVETDPNSYLELPPYAFGTGETGVIDRTRNNGDTILAFAAGRDDEIEAPGVPFPQFARNDEGFSDPATGRIELVDRGWAWNLDIARDPTNASTFTGPSAPVPTTDGRVIFFDRIGADLTPDQDFGRNAMPVIAILNPDGSGRWVRLPDEWGVVASDVWGTVLMRTTQTDFEFALLDDALAEAEPADPDTILTTTTVEPVESSGASTLPQPTAITRTCASEFDCTQLTATETGRIVALDPGGTTLTVYDPTGSELQSSVSIAEPFGDDPTFVVAVGPDDVAYVQIYPTGGTDSQADLLAIPLIGSNAGSVVMRWKDLDGSGDSSLIPRKTGLTVIACCGLKETRPTPDATIYRWVDRSGEVIESTAPSFDLNLGEAGNSLTRIDTGAGGEPVFTRFTLPAVYQYPRDFPRVVATDDGGALAYDFVQSRFGGVEVLVDFDTDWPGAGVDNGDIYYRELGDSFPTTFLEPSGTVIVAEGANGGRFVRRTLDEIATRGWPGLIRVDVDSGSAAAPGLNDYIAVEQPFWANDPELFAFQLEPALSDGADQQIEFDDATAPIITVTTTGLLDDSIDATQLIVTTERADDGLLRFVSAIYGFRCAAGRGHQDFSTEFCV